MQHYEYINKEWLVSPVARRVYRVAAAVSLMLYPLVLAAVLHQKIGFFKPLLLIAVFATALNAVGMQYFLFRFDDSPSLKQAFWFCAMILFPLGPALYCFVVYSHSKPIKKICDNLTDSIAGLQ
jgi:hypothetical protein